MEFDIKVRHGNEGHIEIIDLSKDCNQYIDEEILWQPDLYCYQYSESVTINIVTKVDTDKVTLLDALINDHTYIDNGYTFVNYDDRAAFDVGADGYYQVIHLVLPKKEWLEKCLSFEETPYFLKSNSHTLYYVENDVIMKYNNGNYQQATIAELINLNNPNSNNLQKVTVNLFYLGFLQSCYMNYCKSLFNKLMAHCKPSCKPANVDEDKFARDFVWMTLNVIKYLVQFEQFLEAQRILEQVNNCGGFCNNAKNEHSCSCGCGCNNSSTRSLGCGCNKA